MLGKSQKEKPVCILSKHKFLITCKDAVLREFFPLPARTVMCFYYSKIAQRGNTNLISRP